MNTSTESKRPSAEPCNLFAPDDIVRHVRSGHIERVLGRCTIEATLADCYMYRSTDGHVWIRPVLEMEDGRFVLLTRELDAAQPAPKDREKDRERFSDTAFNRWLDEGISDAGHTVYDTVGDLSDAWAAWQAAAHYGAAQPAQAGEAVYQVKFRTQGSGWVTVDRESYESPLAYLPEHYERRVAYLHPQPEQPAIAVCVCPQFNCPVHTFQSPAVSPPSVVAVREDDVKRAIKAFNSSGAWYPESGTYGMDAMRAALESFASRIARGGERDAVDAARYRWMRDNSDNSDNWEKCVAIIDAAIAQQNKRGGA